MGTLNTAATYSQPFEAQYQGQPVIVLAAGDMEGQSPSLQIVTSSGDVKWVPQEKVTITDPDSLVGSGQRQRQTAGSSSR